MEITMCGAHSHLDVQGLNLSAPWRSEKGPGPWVIIGQPQSPQITNVEPDRIKFRCPRGVIPPHRIDDLCTQCSLGCGKGKQAHGVVSQAVEQRCLLSQPIVHKWSNVWGKVS